jgi:phospholipase/carboxylesterase
MTNQQEAVIIEPANTHHASVIWLHGLGADGHDFEAIVPELGLPDDLGIRFIFPHAPVRPVTINGGMTMRAWYDVRSPDLRQLEDRESIESSTGLLNNYIDAEIARNIPSDQILVAGFSQGGAIALHAGLRYPSRLAGLLALSTYLPLPDRLQSEAHASNSDTPIMVAHGTLDPVIPVFQGKQSYEILNLAGFQITWNEYLMQHEVCHQEIRDISAWILTILSSE